MWTNDFVGSGNGVPTAIDNINHRRREKYKYDALGRINEKIIGIETYSVSELTGRGITI